MPEHPDYGVSAADYREYVDGDNAEAMKPVQTEIVGEVTVREFRARSWAATRYAINDSGPQQIAGALPTRTSLTILNAGTDGVFLSPSREACTPNSGAVLPPGALLPAMEHTAEVWAICDTGFSTDLSVTAEFRDGGTGR